MCTKVEKRHSNLALMLSSELLWQCLVQHVQFVYAVESHKASAHLPLEVKELHLPFHVRPFHQALHRQRQSAKHVCSWRM